MMIPKMYNKLASLLLHCCILFVFPSSESTIVATSPQLQFFPTVNITTNSVSSLGKTRPQNHRNSEKLNTIDICRRSKLDWSSNLESLADCAIGFGKSAIGGRYGMVYTVTDESDQATNPKSGTLRYGVIQAEPLWIVFEKDMNITLEKELMMASNKTIDGRGAKVEITGGPCITMENAKHVIIHGISIRDCQPGKHGLVQITPNRQIHRDDEDYKGDGIQIKNSSNIWIDHCYLSNGSDGLIDATRGSNNITISNCHFTHHVKVMLLGHADGYQQDRVMQVTVAFNHFGPGLRERMPRLRYGYAHVVNNYYEPWLLYAIGGSSNPTILSEANYFVAPEEREHKEVTKREINSTRGVEESKKWRWTSRRDVFINGATFHQSGAENGDPPYSDSQKFHVPNGFDVPAITSTAGPLHCVPHRVC